MFNRSLLAVFFCVLLTCTAAKAQDLCPLGVTSDKLVCLIPHVFGMNGLVVANPDPTVQKFQTNFLSTSLQPLNSAIARQAALLPLASPSSGFVYSWNSATKTYDQATDSFGPILGERAETIGKYQVSLAFDYQYFKFDKIDGIDLSNLPVVLTQPDFVLSDGTICSITARDFSPTDPLPSPGTPLRQGPCGFIRDVTTTNNRLDLKIHQFTTFVTFGLTNRIELSLAIPIENIRMGVFSFATIMQNDFSGRITHAFPPRPPECTVCFTQSFPNVGTASGIGDITLRVKGNVWKSKPKEKKTPDGENKAQDEPAATKGERAALALGVDIRTPTGDALNFLGAGAAGVKPFIIWSYRSQFSPHVFVGYETNGSSLIAGDISTGKKERLLGQFSYSGGVDFWLTKWFTAAFDMVGQQVFQARRTTLTTFKEPGACPDLNCLKPSPPNIDRTLALSTATFNITNASVGIRVKPFATLLVTGNVLIKMNEGGLRASAVPLFGLSYAF